MASTPRSARPGGQPSEVTSRPTSKPSEVTSRPGRQPSEVTSRPEKQPSKPAAASRKPAATPRKRIPRVEETSAGGFVLDSAGLSPKAALIARRDRRGRLIWSLPKGHIEEGETPEQAAIREVFEETGIRGRIVASLGTIDFWFMAENHRVHKTVHHYVLRATGGTLSDLDAEVAEVAWVPLDEVSARLRYADERRLVARVQAVVAERAGSTAKPKAATAPSSKPTSTKPTSTKPTSTKPTSTKPRSGKPRATGSA